MAHLIDKDALVAEIERLRRVRPSDSLQPTEENKLDWLAGKAFCIASLKVFLDTLEVKDPYEQCVQYDSIKAGIQAHAETYSFNIESELFNQLTKEQQALWRKEIEQACISGGNAGYSLAKDPRYKENVEVKEVDLDKEIDNFWDKNYRKVECGVKDIKLIGEHFFELGIKAAQKGE